MLLSAADVDAMLPPPALLKVPPEMSTVPLPPSRPTTNQLFWFTVPPVMLKTPVPIGAGALADVELAGAGHRAAGEVVGAGAVAAAEHEGEVAVAVEVERAAGLVDRAFAAGALGDVHQAVDGQHAAVAEVDGAFGVGVVGDVEVAVVRLR